MVTDSVCATDVVLAALSAIWTEGAMTSVVSGAVTCSLMIDEDRPLAVASFCVLSLNPLDPSGSDLDFFRVSLGSS